MCIRDRPRTVYRMIGGGAIACALAAGLGLVGGTGPSALSSVRLLLVATGLLVAACGLTLRATDRLAWLLAGVAGWLAVFGLPSHWDSARLVAGVMGTLALGGAVLRSVPLSIRWAILSVGVVLHFGAILVATTRPTTYSSPAPWVTDQASNRLYQPYFEFMYLGNAYHFYSPDPGPASHLFFLLEYETDEEDRDESSGQVRLAADGTPAKKRVSEWVAMPRRRTQFRDPLGMTYYRRLSLTELVSYSSPGTVTAFSMEKSNAVQRRRDNELGLNGKPVPGARVGNEIDLSQYRVPDIRVRKIMFPSYARHIALEHSGPRKAADGKTVKYTVTRVKMFRVEHRVLQPHQFLRYDNPAERVYRPDDKAVSQLGNMGPFHPSTYLPFYLGEYDPNGTLVTPNDPLLYWLVPIEHLSNASKDQKSFQDWMSVYAGHEFNWEGKE